MILLSRMSSTCLFKSASLFGARSVNKSTPPDGDFFNTLTRLASREAYDRAGIGPEDLDLVELHDAFTIEEIIYLESLGLCETGQGGKLVQDGVTAITGRHPVNTSGGLISMGHPVGPTGVGQVAEILWQMRGQCGARQIPRPVNWALAHMVGAGGVCGVHLFRKSATPMRVGIIVANLTNELYSEFANASFFRPAPKRQVILTWSMGF